MGARPRPAPATKGGGTIVRAGPRGRRYRGPHPAAGPRRLPVPPPALRRPRPSDGGDTAPRRFPPPAASFPPAAPRARPGPGPSSRRPPARPLPEEEEEEAEAGPRRGPADPSPTSTSRPLFLKLLMRWFSRPAAAAAFSAMAAEAPGG